jgi:MinD-like ATPase involved in chromosome partitioning or flagellar assembly
MLFQKLDNLLSEGGRDHAIPTAPLIRARSLTWAVAGARGGTGKSLIAAHLGTDLASRGWQTLLADLDWAGGSLQTILGGEPTDLNVADVAEGKGPDTPSALPMVCTGLRLIPGVDGFADAPTPLVRRGLLDLLRKLPCHHMVLDLGSGHEGDVTQPFLAADIPLLVCLPDPVGLENAYRFLGGLVRQVALDVFLDIRGASAGDSLGPVHDMDDVRREALRLGMPELVERAADVLGSRPIFLVLNKVRRLGDLEVAAGLERVALHSFGCRLRTVGAVQYDDRVWIAMRKNRDLCAWSQVSKLGDDLRELVDALLMELGIPLGYKARGVARVERRDGERIASRQPQLARAVKP